MKPLLLQPSHRARYARSGTIQAPPRFRHRSARAGNSGWQGLAARAPRADCRCRACDRNRTATRLRFASRRALFTRAFDAPAKQSRMRNSINIAAASIAVAIIAFSAHARADGSIGPVYYPNGDSAVATDECNPGDFCATITLAGGDTIKVLTGGSGRCNPYVMTFMRYHAGLLDRVWSTPTDRNPDSGGSAFSGPQC